MTVQGSIKLRCTVGTSDKEYLIELMDDKNVLARYGKTGSSLSNKNPMGRFDWKQVVTVIKQKIAKGYQLIEVNGKPFLSGDVSDAVRLMETGDWNETKTAQPPLRVRARDVHVTFNPGQIAPIW